MSAAGDLLMAGGSRVLAKGLGVDYPEKSLQ